MGKKLSKKIADPTFGLFGGGTVRSRHMHRFRILSILYNMFQYNMVLHHLCESTHN